MTQTSFSRGTPDVRWYSNSPRLPKKSAVLLLIQSLYRCNTDPGVCVLVWDFPVQSQFPNSWGYPTSHLIPWHIFPKETYNKCIQQWRYNPKGEEITWVHQMNPISKVLQHMKQEELSACGGGVAGFQPSWCQGQGGAHSTVVESGQQTIKILLSGIQLFERPPPSSRRVESRLAVVQHYWVTGLGFTVWPMSWM